MCFFSPVFLQMANQNRLKSDRIRTAPSSATISRPGGEIGRHKRLKISRLYGRAGSIPAPGTNEKSAGFQIGLKNTMESCDCR